MPSGAPDYHAFYTPVDVVDGGTARTTLTLNGVLYGQGGLPVAVSAAGAAGNVFRVPSGGGDPAFGALDVSSSGAVTGLERLEAIRWPKYFSGANATAKIDAAIADITSGQGLVQIAPDLGAGQPTAMSDAVRLLDLRQDQGFNYLGDNGSEQQGGLVLRGLYTRLAAAQGAYADMHPMQIVSESWHGGVNFTEGLSWKSTYRALTGVLLGRTRGQHIGLTQFATGFSMGDLCGLAVQSLGYGGLLDGGDESSGRALLLYALQGTAAFTATVSTATPSGANVILAYASAVNENTRGEDRYVLNTNPAKVYSTGTYASHALDGSGRVQVTFTGSWFTGFCAPGTHFQNGEAGRENQNGYSDLCLVLDNYTNHGLKLAIPVYSVDSNTQLTLHYWVKGVYGNLPYSSVLAGSTFTLYHAGRCVSLATTGQITVTGGVLDASSWAAADTLEMPLAYNYYPADGVALHCQQELPSAAGPRGFTVYNDSTWGATASSLGATSGQAFGVSGPWPFALRVFSDVGEGVLFDGNVTYGMRMIQPTSNSLIAWGTASDGIRTIGVDRVTAQMLLNATLRVGKSNEVGIGTNAQAGIKLYLYSGAGADQGIQVALPAGGTGFGLQAAYAGVPACAFGRQVAYLNNGVTFTGYADNAGTISWQFISAPDGVFAIGTTPATAGNIRLGSSSEIDFRNFANSGNIKGLTKDSTNVVILGDTAGAKAAGNFAAPQLQSTIATGTPPLIIASMTPVDTLNVNIVNWTWISNQPTLGQLLIAKGTSEAAWATPDGARVYNNADLSLTSGATTTLAFNSERWDNGGLHDTVTNNSRLTAVKAGKYLITLSLVMDGNATGYRRVYIVDNWGNPIAVDWRPGSSADYQGFSLSTIYHLLAAEYVIVQVYQNSGSTLYVRVYDKYTPEFAMQWLGP